MTEEKRGPGRPPMEKLYPVKLLKNYVPLSDKVDVVLAQEPSHPGVGFKNKLWAGSIVKFPKDEAISLVRSRRAERADEFSPD